MASEDYDFNKFVKSIKWLHDEWVKDKNWIFLDIIDNEKDPNIIILTHWLTYIHERVKSADKLWRETSTTILKLVKRYIEKDVIKKEDIDKIYKSYEEDIGGFKSDREGIKRTLKNLLEYGKNIFIYLQNNYKENDVSRDPGHKIAHLFYDLTYSSEKKDNLEEIWYKRIWAALRDYKIKPSINKIFIKGLPNSKFKNIWKNDFLESQLEMPGDIWNNRFAENILKKYAKEGEIYNLGKERRKGVLYLNDDKFLKSINTSKLVRLLYEDLYSIDMSKYYPCHMDVSFAFFQNMCSFTDKNSICGLHEDICMFGSSGGENICKPGSKVCSVLLTHINIVKECNNENCPILKGKCAKLCNG